MAGLTNMIFGTSEPDNSGINRAAEANAGLAKESLDWYKQIYAEQAPTREAAATRANKVSDAQLTSMTQNDAISQDYANYQRNTFRPLEAGIIADAKNYDTNAAREKLAGTAMADVTQNLGRAQRDQDMQLTRMGVNPNSGQYAALQNQQTIQKAGLMAQAANSARDRAETQGYARKMDAANMGRNLASNQATSAATAMSAGNSSVQNAGVPLAQSNAATAMMGNGFNSAMNGNSSAGSMYGTVYNGQIAQRGQDMQMITDAMKMAAKP